MTRALRALGLITLVACGCGPQRPTDDNGAVAFGARAEALTSGTVALNAGANSATAAYDFSAKTYQFSNKGDFYYSGGKFWANNTGQRGLVSVGPCTGTGQVKTMPTTGYSRQGVTATAGTCYVARTHNDERDFIVFRVSSATSTTVSLTFTMTAGAFFGTTFVINSPKEGYDFAAKKYVPLQSGDFYYGNRAFWANNTGQRGVIAAGPCTSPDDVKEFPAADFSVGNPDDDGYNLWNVVAAADACYVALARSNTTDFIVFQVETLDDSSATITWKRIQRPVVNHCVGGATPSTDIDCWLATHGNVANQLMWLPRLATGVSVPVPWLMWSAAQKADLRAAVATDVQLLAGTLTADPDQPADPPANAEQLRDTDPPVAVFRTSDAWHLFVKTVAMSLAVEMTQSVPWTITDSGVDEGNRSSALASLFDARHMFLYTWPGRPFITQVFNPHVEGYQLISNTYDTVNHRFVVRDAFAVPTTPDKALRFLRDNQLIGDNVWDTIGRTVEWAKRLRHAEDVSGGYVNTWHYRGPAPVARTIDGTVDTAFSIKHNDNRAYHWTAGCWGTSELFHAVLRMINIPVDTGMGADYHSHTRFMTAWQGLSHGDNPYFAMDPTLPGWSVLLDYGTYNSWFGTTDADQASANLDRGPAEAAIRLLSDWPLDSYCTDLQTGVGHAGSSLAVQFANASPIFTVGYLENLPPNPWDPSAPASLWDRLAQVVSAYGSCDRLRQYRLTPDDNVTCAASLPAPERPKTCSNSFDMP